MTSHIELIKALTPLAWPLIAVLALWLLWGPVAAVVESRRFEVEVAGFKLSVGESIHALNRQIGELKSQLAEIEASTAIAMSLAPQGDATSGDADPGGAMRGWSLPTRRMEAATGGGPAPAPPPRPGRLLWVDDRPEGNAFAIEQLRQQGRTVALATSTDEGVRKLVDASEPYDMVLSDMGRTEGGRYRPRAGLELLERARDAGVEAPFVFFTTAATASRDEIRRRLEADGAASITGSTADLFALVRDVASSPPEDEAEGSG